jgi:hypothetical protein
MANLLCCCDRSVLFFAERSTGCAGANSFGRAAPGELLRQGDGRAGQAPSPESPASLCASPQRLNAQLFARGASDTALSGGHPVGVVIRP